MVLSHEAQHALILLARRRTKNYSCEFWGSSNIETGEWTCLACGEVVPKEILAQYDGTPSTHKHGLGCLKKHGLLAFL